MNAQSMFQKLLIANRGEIACRVIRTAQQLGIRTVAVYSEADQDGLHVELADEAILIGASPVSESYLDIGRVLQACQSTGADAVHPGYGFLSENPRFVQAHWNRLGFVLLDRLLGRSKQWVTRWHPSNWQLTPECQ